MIPKALFSTYPMLDKMLNPAYQTDKSSLDPIKYGSRNCMSTDHHINGEYFRSRTDNQYFCVIDKNTKINEISMFIGDFRSLNEALRIRSYNPDKNIILRLEFTKNKAYFVENYQAITIKNPDITIMNMPLEELISITPKFEPLPHRF